MSPVGVRVVLTLLELAEQLRQVPGPPASAQTGAGGRAIAYGVSAGPTERGQRDSVHVAFSIADARDRALIARRIEALTNRTYVRACTAEIEPPAVRGDALVEVGPWSIHVVTERLRLTPECRPPVDSRRDHTAPR